MLSQDPIIVDAFDGDAVATTWRAIDSTVAINREPARLKEGSGSLRWEARAERASVTTTKIPADWTEIGRLTAFVLLADEKARTLEVELREKQGSARFWRKIALKPLVWTEISLGPYQFRAEGAPSWKRIASLGFVLRDGPANLYVDTVTLARHKGELPPFLEPGDALVKRAFGESKDVVRTATRNFRAFSNAPLDGDKLGAALEEFFVLFRKSLALKEADLDYPVTLVIHSKRDAYVDFAVRTARDVYGAEVPAKRIWAEGYTFFDYSFTSYLNERHERRPVFFHEVCHQLLTRLLGLRGALGATWVEEGLCYFLQNEFIPQDDLGAEVKSLLDNARRPKLADLDGRIAPQGAVNLQALSIMAFLHDGRHKEHFAKILATLAKDASLAAAVENVLKTTTAEFDAEWQAWCRERYK